MTVKISRLLAVIMLFTTLCTIPSYAADDFYNSEMIEECNYGAELLSALEVYDDAFPDVSKQVSRSEFAKIISKFRGIVFGGAKASGSSIFSDVKTEDENYPYMENAVESGWMQTAGKAFYPGTSPCCGKEPA